MRFPVFPKVNSTRFPFYVYSSKLRLNFLNITAVGDSKRIQLENMLGVYLVLAAGGCFSVILVLVEIWWRKHGRHCVAVLRTKLSFMR